VNRIYVALVALVMGSCGNQNPKAEAPVAVTPAATETPAIVAADSFNTGVIIPSVSLRNVPSESFALYLPKGFAKDTTVPVAIVFFDPHGDGTLPLNLYKTLADQHQVILIGSNTSRNGMDMQMAQSVSNNLITDVMPRLQLTKENLTLCGFSGGAKVALLAAAQNPNVANVIYCGAAAPVQPNHPLRLLGFAGTRDMNYTDVVGFDRSLNAPGLSHNLIEWQGKHEFPDAKTFADAFEWLSPSNLIDFKKKQATITPQKLAEEDGQKQRLIKAFQVEDINWWKKEIASLNSKKKTDPMYDRLLGFISLACYSYAGQTLQQNNLTAAEKILTIYTLADPGNKDCEKFTQQLRERQGVR
jgi:pimeloyl-ACP methyl ester carboxylesterase